MAREPVVMPGVRLLSNLAPVDHPQFVPSSPQRLPPPGDRPSRRVGGAGLMFGSPLPPTATTPEMIPAPGVARAIALDPHHYASLTEGVVTVAIFGGAASLTPFLTEPGTKRNFLALRNTQPAGGATIFVSFGRVASLQSWLAIPANTIVGFDDVVPQNDVYVGSAAGGEALAYSYSTIPTA